MNHTLLRMLQISAVQTYGMHEPGVFVRDILLQQCCVSSTLFSGEAGATDMICIRFLCSCSGVKQRIYSKIALCKSQPDPKDPSLASEPEAVTICPVSSLPKCQDEEVKKSPGLSCARL